MPIVISHSTSGWGCTCPSFQHRVPSERLLNRVAAAADVKISLEYYVPCLDGGEEYHWKAWTHPDNVYEVTFSPYSGGDGTCKHVLACAAGLVGGQLKESYRLIGDLQAQCELLEKEVKGLNRKLTQKSAKKKSSPT